MVDDNIAGPQPSLDYYIFHGYWLCYNYYSIKSFSFLIHNIYYV